MAGWDGDALAESMEQAMERQQEAAEAWHTRGSSPHPRSGSVYISTKTKTQSFKQRDESFVPAK